MFSVNVSSINSRDFETDPWCYAFRFASRARIWSTILFLIKLKLKPSSPKLLLPSHSHTSWLISFSKKILINPLLSSSLIFEKPMLSSLTILCWFLQNLYWNYFFISSLTLHGSSQHSLSIYMPLFVFFILLHFNIVWKYIVYKSPASSHFVQAFCFMINLPEFSQQAPPLNYSLLI